MIPQGEDRLKLVEMIGMESYDEKTGKEFRMHPQCYRIQNGKKTIISEAELKSAWKRFSDSYPDNPTKYANLVFVSLIQ